jgi:FkbM family methyltransferase
MFRYLKYITTQISHFVADLWIPIQFKFFSNSKLSSSRELVLGILKLMRPVPSPLPLVRVGPAGDGGYLVPDDLENIKACFSPGVSDEAGFELAFANRGVPCFLADASVPEEPVKHQNIFFDPLFLGPISDSKKFISLEDWVEQKSVENGDLILQMDIEGAEYDVLSSAPAELLKRFRLIAIELHNLEFILTNKLSALSFESFLKMLLENFEVVHIHPNNNRRPVFHKGIEIPPVIEMTLLRKDRFVGKQSLGPVALPHPLDSDNSPRRKHLTFSSDWIG